MTSNSIFDANKILRPGKKEKLIFGDYPQCTTGQRLSDLPSIENNACFDQTGSEKNLKLEFKSDFLESYFRFLFDNVSLVGGQDL